MTWSANWSASQGKGKIPRVAFEELRQAFVERMTVINQSISVRLNTPLITGQLIESAWFTDFQSAMTGSLFPLYHNHNIWDGTGAGVPPVYTQATMLTAIGDASRITAPTSHKIAATWAYQQYKMLNMLRWSRQVSLSMFTYNSSDFRYASPPSGWGGSSWVADSPIEIEASARHDSGNDTYRRRVNVSVSPLYSHSFKGYPKLTFNNIIALGGDAFYTELYASSNYWTISDASEYGTSDNWTFDFGNINTMPADPGSGAQSWMADFGNVYTPILTMCWTGPNGFTFKDW